MLGFELVGQVHWYRYKSSGSNLWIGKREFPCETALRDISKALDHEGQFRCSVCDNGRRAIGFSVGKEESIDRRLLQMVVPGTIKVVWVGTGRAACCVALALFVLQKRAVADVINPGVKSGIISVDIHGEYKAAVECVSPTAIIGWSQKRVFVVPYFAQQASNVFVTPGVELGFLYGVGRIKLGINIDQVLKVEIVDVGTIFGWISTIDKRVNQLTQPTGHLLLPQPGLLGLGIDPCDLVCIGPQCGLNEDPVFTRCAPINGAPSLFLGLLEGTGRRRIRRAGGQRENQDKSV